MTQYKIIAHDENQSAIDQTCTETCTPRPHSRLNLPRARYLDSESVIILD